MSLKLTKNWLGFLAMGLGFALVYLDQTALNVALTTIQVELGANDTQLFWIVNAYLLPLAIFGLGSGRIGDMIGLRKLFLIGLVFFGLASIGCALSFSSWFLILFRAFQGIGGAVVPVCCSACVYHLFPEGKRGKPMGLVGFMASISILIGPIIGGLFTSMSTWRWIFWINPIVCIVCFLLIYYTLKNLDEQREKGTTFDYIGFLFFLAFLTPIIISLMQGERWGWSNPVIITFLCVGVVFLPIFIYYEKKLKYPLFDFNLMKNLNFTIACIVFFCGQFAFIASVFIALYLMKSLGKSPFKAGLCLMPTAIIAGFMNPIAGSWTDKIGYRKQIQMGLSGAVIAYTFISLTAHTMSYFWLLVGLVINGFSISTFFMATYAMLIHSAPRHRQGMAAGMAATYRQVGASFAMSIIGIIIIVVQRIEPSIGEPVSFMHGFSVAMALVAFVMTLALLSSVWIDRKKSKYGASREEEEIPTKLG